MHSDKLRDPVASGYRGRTRSSLGRPVVCDKCAYDTRSYQPARPHLQHAHVYVGAYLDTKDNGFILTSCLYEKEIIFNQNYS